MKIKRGTLGRNVHGDGAGEKKRGWEGGAGESGENDPNLNTS